MKALQYRRFGAGPEVVEIDRPAPGPGEVLVKITASGICHSDEHVMSLPAEHFPYAMPQTLGHEPAGTVAEVGAGVTRIELGTPVVVYGPWGCGWCAMCADGTENLCLTGMTAPGLGSPGAMAEYMIVDDVRHLVPIGDFDPVSAAPLTDAALTSYQAIKSVMNRFVAGSTTVVIGAGGLGHMAIQLLRALTGTRVIALDLGEARLAFAREVGAHAAVESNREAGSTVREMTGGRGADVVLDFVGTDITGRLAVACGGVGSSVVLIGAGGGGVTIGLTSAPLNMTVSTSFWGRRQELIELVAMARRGQISVRTTTFPLDEGPRAYELLRRGEIRGRGVIVPA
jgi:propanol-preferring alcohol dehydrogenase